MADDVPPRTDLLPDEMLKFLLDITPPHHQLPRLGQLISHTHAPIATPHFVAASSRGIIPHLSHDVLPKHTSINAVYMGLEDFIEKSPRSAPIFHTPKTVEESVLRKFTALPSQCLSILGPRRVPRIPTAAQNTDSSIAICTSVGFRTLEFDDYLEAVSKLKPDIAASMPDIPSAERVSKRRVEKAADRTHAWLRDTVTPNDEQQSPLFASIPPLTAEQQQLYLSDLATDFLPSLSGLCIYEPSTAITLPRTLSRLPLLCIFDPPTPHDLLHAISLGIDLITVPFVTAASEQGIAFTFTFPVPSSDTTDANGTSSPNAKQKQPLGIDLFATQYATSLDPLCPNPPPTPNNSSNTTITDAKNPFPSACPNQTPPPTPAPCNCYTCTSHHRAYIHHLLSTHEMLAWTLLQIHNFAVLNTFYTNIRLILSTQGRDGFEREVQRFEEYYFASPDLVLRGGERERSGVGDGDGTSIVDDRARVREGSRILDINDDIADSLEDRNDSAAVSATDISRGPRLRGYQRKSQGKQLDKKREKVWGRFDSMDTDTGTSSPASGVQDESVESDQALKIKEAREAVAAAVPTAGRGKTTAHEDIDRQQGEVKQQHMKILS